MKGMISLADFIKEVKADLLSAIDTDTPFFEIGDVELEVAFALDASAKAGAKLFVVDIGGETKATKTHKVKVKLHPFVKDKQPVSAPPEPRPRGTPVGSKKKNRLVTRAKPAPIDAQNARVRPVAHKKLPSNEKPNT